jgi:hypothetical protein
MAAAGRGAASAEELGVALFLTEPRITILSPSRARRRVTFSRNVTLSLSRTCVSHCKYCAFQTYQPHLHLPDEVEALLNRAAKRSVKELLVLTGHDSAHHRHSNGGRKRRRGPERRQSGGVRGHHPSLSPHAGADVRTHLAQSSTPRRIAGRDPDGAHLMPSA